MAPEPRYADPALFGTGRAFVHPQPKGVVGNISPWNFPFDLSVGPLVEMLAAGNRVVLKPSEYTPACAEVLRDMIRATFDRDRVDVVVGGARARQGVQPGALGSPALHGQPGGRARDRESGGRAARAGDAGAGRKVPGDPHRRLRSTPSRSSRSSAPRRSRTARCASRSTTAWCRASRSTSSSNWPPARARQHARLLPLGEQHRDHHRAPPRAHRAAARGCPRPRLRRTAARGGRARSTPRRGSCRCRS